MKKLKVVAIVLVMGLSVAMFTGCSISLDQSTQNKLQQQIDLLQQQNQNLQQENANLEQLIQQNNKLTKQEAYSIYKNAAYGLWLNKNDILNNCYIESSEDAEGSSETKSFYLTEEGYYIQLIQYSENEFYLYYEDATGIYYYSNSDNKRYKLECESMLDTSKMGGYIIDSVYDITEENIYNFSTLDNGNVMVDISFQSYNEYRDLSLLLASYEIDAAGKIVMVKLQYGDIYIADDGLSSIGEQMVVEFKYGEVDELDMLVKLQVAKNAPLAN